MQTSFAIFVLKQMTKCQVDEDCTCMCPTHSSNTVVKSDLRLLYCMWFPISEIQIMLGAAL